MTPIPEPMRAHSPNGFLPGMRPNHRSFSRGMASPAAIAADDRDCLPLEWAEPVEGGVIAELAVGTAAPNHERCPCGTSRMIGSAAAASRVVNAGHCWGAWP